MPELSPKRYPVITQNKIVVVDHIDLRVQLLQLFYKDTAEGSNFIVPSLLSSPCL